MKTNQPLPLQLLLVVAMTWLSVPAIFAQQNGAGETRAAALAQRSQQIDQAVATGRLGPLEAELMKLRLNRGDDPQAHRQAVRAWQKANAAALKAETEARRAGTKAERDAERVQVTRERNQQIDRAKASGQIGPREAELMKLMQNRGKDPKAHRAAIRAWQENNGAALKAEREARDTTTKIQRDAERAEAATERKQQIDQAVADGHMGPLEAELMKLMQDRSKDPQARRAAVRAWQEQHGAALKTELRTRRTRQPSD